MACTVNSLQYYPGDNEEIKVTIRNEDGTRISGFQTDVTEIIFQAKDDNGSVVMDLRFTGGYISFGVEQDSTNADQDVITISPTIASTQIPTGTYDIFLRISLMTPVRNLTVNMIRDGAQLTKLVILDGGVTP